MIDLIGGRVERGRGDVIGFDGFPFPEQREHEETKISQADTGPNDITRDDRENAEVDVTAIVGRDHVQAEIEGCTAETQTGEIVQPPK